MNEIEERRNRLEEMAQDLIESLPDSGHRWLCVLPEAAPSGGR